MPSKSESFVYFHTGQQAWTVLGEVKESGLTAADERLARTLAPPNA
jgi:hypothetical protein